MRRYLIVIVLIELFAFSSCSDFLDQKSRTQTDAKAMFENQQGFMDALTECYKKMTSSSLFGENLSITLIECMAQHWDLDEPNDRFLATMKQLDFTTDDSKSTFSSIYGQFYNIISQANIVLKHLQETGDVIKDVRIRNIIDAEAHAIRGFIHMEVLRLYGQLPQNSAEPKDLAYVETFGVGHEIKYYNFTDFVQKIFDDFNYALDLMETSDPCTGSGYSAGGSIDNFLQYRRYRLNYHAVKALEARLYLYLGNTEKAYSTAKEVVNAFSPDYYEKDENDVVIDTIKGHKLFNFTGDSDTKNEYYTLPNETFFILSHKKLDGNISSINTSGKRLLINTFELMFPKNRESDIRALRLWDRSQTDASGTNYALLKKYLLPSVQEQEEGKISDNTMLLYRQIVPMVRLAEMYLILIETAPIEEANEYYKVFMAGRNVLIKTDFSEEERENIVAGEYHRELFAEGQMFYYYKRKAATSMLWQRPGTPPLTEKNYVVPIPETELQNK